MNATVPLQDALPWSPDSCRNILVTDSIATDGRFVLYTMATQALQTQHAVWWVTASPITDQQVATSLKKMGCDAAASYLRASTLGSAATSSARPLLQITTCATDWALQVMAGDGDTTTSPENYLKQLYRSIQTWLTQNNTGDDKPTWIVLDDLSSMSTLLNDSSVVYRFVDSLVALSNRSESPFGLILRCSNTPDSMEMASSVLSQDTPSVEDRVGWIGAGGMTGRRSQAQDYSYVSNSVAPWEHVLDECVDAIVDVVPLTGGYSREAHGRLVFTEYPGGRGWKDVSTVAAAASAARPASSWQPSVMNYCILDQGVRAIRLHQKAAVPASS